MSAAEQQLPTPFLRDVLTSILRELGHDAACAGPVEVRAGVARTGSQDNSVVYHVLVRPDPTDDSANSLALFFKCLFNDVTRSKALNSSEHFKNEANFYSHVLPALLKFQAERMSRVTTPFSSVPTCYKCVSDEQNDVIVMEDLKSRGYVKVNRFQGMEMAEIDVMFRELGRFHALSLAMKDQDPMGFHKARTALRQGLFSDLKESVFRRLFSVAGEDAMRLVKEKYPPDSAYVTKTQQFVDEIHGRLSMLATPDHDEPHNVINHGDLWINNYLFRHEGQEDAAICFVDFQLCHYASLALDLSCALLLSVAGPTRAERRDALLRAYHDALSALMTQLGSNPDAVIPFRALSGLVNKYAQFAVAMVILILPVQLNESQDLRLLDRAEALISDRCKHRILEVIEDAVDYGYFDQLVLPCEGEYETTRL